MKKTLWIAAALLCGCATNNYTIDGRVEGLEGTVYLFAGDQLLDSARVDRGAFRFKGTIEAPETRVITDAADENGTFGTMLILEPGTIRLKSDPANPGRIIAAGTPSNDAKTAFEERLDALVKEFRDPDTSEERREAILEENETLRSQACENNRDNYFGVLILAESTYGMSGRELLDEIDLFSPEMQQTERMLQLRRAAEQKMKTDIGQPCIDIAQPDASGKIVTLRSVIEKPGVKLTLVDFWASWCRPCMGEVPHLKKAYADFRKRGFEIYGVSFDSDRDNWLQAVARHGMKWIHVSELNGFDNQAAKDYSVQGIPSNFLIDSQGTIVATNLRGDELHQKLAELLK